jgi:hypothetical protein
LALYLLSARALEQLIAHRIVRTSGEAAFQQGRNDVERHKRDHEPHRGARKEAGRGRFAQIGLRKLAVKQQRDCGESDRNGKTDICAFACAA